MRVEIQGAPRGTVAQGGGTINQSQKFISESQLGERAQTAVYIHIYNIFIARDYIQASTTIVSCSKTQRLKNKTLTKSMIHCTRNTKKE